MERGVYLNTREALPQNTKERIQPRWKSWEMAFPEQGVSRGSSGAEILGLKALRRPGPVVRWQIRE